MHKQLILLLLFVCSVSLTTAETWDTYSDTWVGTDTLGRKLPTTSEAGQPREGKTVGLFYYIWHGSHGYDEHEDPSREDPSDGQGAPRPDPKADVESPRVIPEIIEAPLGERKWGPITTWHHWGESIFDHYVANDEWLIRKQAQMFKDAGVDVVIFDVTNGFHYRDTYMEILRIYEDIRSKGGQTPYIAFNAGTIPEHSVVVADAIYRDLYSKGKYKDLWFYWKGKPLLLANFNALDQKYKDFFNIRYSWAWSRAEDGAPSKWFGDGKDRWPWLDRAPQAYGWHESSDMPEQMVVAAAEHPNGQIGKSYSYDKGQQTRPFQTPKGIYFDEQWKYALEADPEFILITQWNEWIAMRFDHIFKDNYMGENLPEDHPKFVDIFDTEYSRDIEPMKGGYGDSYYYQMIDGIRRYKGVRQAPSAGAEQRIDFAKGFADWESVEQEFRDDIYDAYHRDHFGWGNVGHLTNSTGRNDIKRAKVARDADNIYFYVETEDTLTPRSGENWMELFIATDQDKPNWEGYHYRVHLDPLKKDRYILQESLGGFLWCGVCYVDFISEGNQLALKVYREALGLSDDYSFCFKWSDNRQTEKVIDWLTDGDAAPNARFQYLYR